MQNQLNISMYLSESSFQKPLWFRPSAWLQHAPFMFFLMERLKPNNYVELGTHHGFSFFSACQTVRKYRLDTRCFAIDTWQGDEHAGFYGNEIFNEVSENLQNNYSDIAELKRKTFSEALDDFSDGTIDLLHIDGRHFYDDVREDFTSWLPKMSNSGIVMFHDTQVRERNFGVYKFFEQLKELRPTFEFKHGYGLGVVPTGNIIPDSILPFFLLEDNPEMKNCVKMIYNQLGNNIESQFNNRNY